MIKKISHLLKNIFYMHIVYDEEAQFSLAKF